jgi:hypothetical protein
MIAKHLRVLSVALALTAVLAGTSAGQTTQSVQTAPPRAFLTPLPSRFVIPPGDPRQPKFCRELQPPHRCPPVLVYGGDDGGLPTIDPALKADLPNVRVTMVVQGIVNEVVANGGVDPDQDILLWWATINTGTVPVFPLVESGTAATALPEPGETAYEGDNLVMYDAIVYGACESLSAFRIDHTASIKEGGAFGVELGAFHGVDNSTLDSTGFYNFRYTVRAKVDSGVSDFHVFGKVNLTCSGANSLGW